MTAIAHVPPAPGIRRCTIAIEGVVQGVGFRPAVCRLANRHRLSGSVRNSLQGVLVDVEGHADALDRFLRDLASLTPPASQRAVHWLTPRGTARAFAIEPSDLGGPARLLPTPDVPTCEECLAEMRDPRARRHRYPLVTCAVCGPRFTIVRALPFDRERTAMAVFPPCAPCRGEYEAPGDRRFHAETIACPACGPRLALLAPDGAAIGAADAVAAVAAALVEGGIVAIKGIGGYHLACDATRADAVAGLRRRKRRDAKPLAVMVRDVDVARRLCEVSPAEARLLTSAARPIVLLVRRPTAAVTPDVAPGTRRLGLMLPYTPLHHLLLDAVDRPLVMTSGNASDDVIAYRDDDAAGRLRGIADLVLTHDRPIEMFCDDSVAQVVREAPRLIRRSRGYVPLAIRLPVAASRPVLACGGDLKSAFALVRGREAFMSQHVGDLTHERAFRAWADALGHLRRLLDVTPVVVAHDLHPAYRSTVYARALEGVERIAVQHHHAHVASCLADNGVDRRVIGVAWDGTGHGADGHAWGGEFLVADLAGFARAGHLEYVPLPGGDRAAREPWRMAAAFLQAAYGEAMHDLDLAFVRRLDRAAWRLLGQAIARGLNAPLTSSAGRLFDAVASLLGVRDRVGFEAQAAMELEALAGPRADRTYPTAVVEHDAMLVVRTPDIVRGVVEDLVRRTPPAAIAARFHATLADVLVQVCRRIRERTGLDAVALSGGVFQNAWLLESAVAGLAAAGFEVYSHRQVPANDGGLALGQAAVAARRLADAEGAR